MGQNAVRNFFHPKFFPSETFCIRNLFVRNPENLFEILASKVFCPKFFPPKFLVYNVSHNRQKKILTNQWTLIITYYYLLLLTTDVLILLQHNMNCRVFHNVTFSFFRLGTLHTMNLKFR